MLTALLLITIFAVAATLFRDGLWSNAITFINIVVAGLIAVNYFEPLTRYLSGLVVYMDYNWDIIALGLIFALAYAALRYIGLQVSQYRVRFHPLLDKIGSGLLSVASGWVVVCFLTFSLHTSPLARNFLGGGFVPEDKMFFGTGPDRLWLGFINRNADGGGWGTNAVGSNGQVRTQFDPDGDYLIRYASRRTYLETRVSNFAAGS